MAELFADLLLLKIKNFNCNINRIGILDNSLVTFSQLNDVQEE